MIFILVEGDCEKHVLPILIERERENFPVRYIDMGGKSNIVRLKGGFEDTIRRKVATERGRSFIVLIDGDIISPPYYSLEEELSGMEQRARSLAQELRVPVQICWAVFEIESWLIGGLINGVSYCGLKGIGQVPANTEATPRDPKRWLKDHLRSEYDPQTQRCLAQKMDLQAAKAHNRSMQVFFDYVRQIRAPAVTSRRPKRH